MYELLVKGGTLIDPAQRIHAKKDVGISQGKVETIADDIESSEAKKVIDAGGKIVTPGLIDMHTHVVGELFSKEMAMSADEAGVLSGVATVCDAGSFGHANFLGFKRFVVPQARTDVFAFLHLSATGLAVMPEIWSRQNINPDATLRLAEENRDIIKGIKIRAVGALIESLGAEGIRTAKKVAVGAGLPLMVHVGIAPEEKTPGNLDTFTREMLEVLDKGDIVTHVYTGKVGGMFSRDGKVLPELREALQRGVLLDVAQAKTNWSLEAARRGIEQGILPTTMSTDLFKGNVDGPVFSLLATMSRFLVAGLTLEQMVEMTTINPARILGEEKRRGSLRKGMPADISIFEIMEGDFTFEDGVGEKRFKGNRLLVPKLTLKSGVEIEARSRFK